jgi:hypothetical protein
VDRTSSPLGTRFKNVNREGEKLDCYKEIRKKCKKEKCKGKGKGECKVVPVLN